MKEPAPLKNNFISLGTFDMKSGDKGYVEVRAAGANGTTHADAVQIVEVK